MRFSTKSRFATTAMMYLALNGKGTPATAAEISQDQGISISYLEQLFARLRRAGLVTGVRGPGGGYMLAKPAEEITLADIATAVDPNAYISRAQNVVDLHTVGRNATRDMWDALSMRFHDFLRAINLAEAVRLTGQVLPGSTPRLEGKRASG